MSPKTRYFRGTQTAQTPETRSGYLVPGLLNSTTINDSPHNSNGVAAMDVRRTERTTEESQKEENYESDYSYDNRSEDDDEDDDRKESASLKNLSIMVPRQLSGKKREALALSGALFASAVPETSTASNPKELDVAPRASSPDLVLGSQCVHCRFERHDPVGCCDQVTEWVERRHQLCTVPPSVLQMCVARYIQMVAEGANMTLAEAVIWCRQVGWQLNLRDIRVPRVENIHRNVVNRHVAQDVEQAAPEGNLSANNINSNKPSLSTCPICFEDNLLTETMYSMQCGHAFCFDCWRSLIDAMLSETDEVAMSTSCPQVGCVRTINEVVIEAVMPEFIPRFENHQRHSFVVGHSRTVRWCPGPDCDQVAILPRQGMFEDHSENFRCDKCSTHFCFACGRAPHQGNCEPDPDLYLMPNRVAAVAAQAVDNTLFDERDDKMRKHCPKCKIPVEKTGGCNRMRCQCKKTFCWLCLGDYDTFDSHKCGVRRQLRATGGSTRVDLDFCQAALIDQPTDDTEVQKTARALRNLEHYAHCYNRYYAHRQGQDFAAGQCLCVTRRNEDYIQMAGFQTANETDFIQSANETLVASRRLLKYAYICSFYSKRDGDEDKEHSHLGFLHLERLERFTEELSGVSENALTRRDRTRVLDLIAVVTQCMRLLACFEFHESVANAAEYNNIDAHWKRSYVVSCVGKRCKSHHHLSVQP